MVRKVRGSAVQYTIRRTRRDQTAVVRVYFRDPYGFAPIRIRTENTYHADLTDFDLADQPHNTHADRVRSIRMSKQAYIMSSRVKP